MIEAAARADEVVDAVMAALEAQTVVVPAETTIGRVISELVVDLDRVYARRVALATRSRTLFSPTSR